MLISALDNVLHFNDLCSHQQVCSRQFACPGEVRSFSINSTDEFLFCLLANRVPSILNVHNPYKIRILQNVDALDSISVGRFQRHHRAALLLGTDLSIVAIYNILNRAVTKVRSLPGPVVDLTPNQDDEFVGVACCQGEIFVLQISDLDILHVFKEASKACSVRFHPTIPNILGVHDQDGFLRFFNTGDPERKTSKKVPGGIRAFDFIPNNEHVVTVGNANKCSIFNMKTHEFVFHHHLSAEPVCVAVCNNHFALGMDNGCIHLIDIHNYLTPWKTVQCSEARIQHVTFMNRFKFPDRQQGSQQSQSSGSRMDVKVNPVEVSPPGNNRNNMVMFAETEDNVLHSIKKELISNVYNAIADVETCMKQQVGNLKNYVQVEFDKMDKLNDLAWMKIYNSLEGELDSKASLPKK